MPIPSAITDLSTTPASNSPAGSDAPTQGDDHIRAAYAFIRQIYDSGLSTAERLSWDVYVTDDPFGAVGDGSTDSTAALAAAVTYVNSLCVAATDPLYSARRPRLIFPPCLGFVSTAGLSISADVEVVMQSPLLINKAAGTPIVAIDMVDIRGATAFKGSRSTSSIFWVRRLTQSDWSSENDIGVRINAQYASDAYFKYVDGFTVAVDACLGYGRVSIGDLRNAKIYFKVQARTAPVANFTNFLRVNGGAFACDTGVGTGLARYGIKVLGAAGPNSLVFDGQSYELAKATAGAADCIPIWCDATTGNMGSVRFLNQRTEAIGGTVARLQGNVNGVEIGLIDGQDEFSFPTSLMLDDQSNGSNYLYRHEGGNAPHWNEFFTTGRLAERVVGVTGAAMSIVNMEACTNAGAAPTPPLFSATGAVTTFDAAGAMTTGSVFYGVRVNLNGARSLAISGTKPAGQAVTAFFVCFDSSGVQITTASAVRAEGANASVNTAVFGGLFNIGLTPANASIAFDGVISFASTVATVFISIGTPVSSWVIKRLDGRPSWFSSTSHMREQFVASAIPVALTNVTYKSGMRAAQITPAVGSPKGWVLDNGGTWRSEGNL